MVSYESSLTPPHSDPEPRRITFEELEAVLSMSPDALVLVNKTGSIVRVNGLAADLFGYTESALAEKSLEILLPPRFRVRHYTFQQHYFTLPRARPMGAGLQLFGLREDGSEFPIDISLRPLMLGGVLHTLGAIRDMTIQLVSEREREAQVQHVRLLTDLINLAPDAIFLRDSISRITFWNQGAQELYGWSAQEALGRVSHSLLKTRFPEGRATLDTHLEQVGRWEGELTHTTHSGRILSVESRQVLVRGENGEVQSILEVNRDITERTRKQQATQVAYSEITQRETVLQQIIDALPCSVYLVAGSSARLLLANRATERVWGACWPLQQPMSVFLHANHITLFDVGGRPMAEDQFATLRALCFGEVVLQYQQTIRRPDGTSLPVLVHAIPLTFPKNGWLPTDESVALVIHQDVSSLKENEYLKDEFVGIAAHELRTPLAVLAGYAEMLLTQPDRGHGVSLDPWQQEALLEIKEATVRLTTLTEDLLDITRLQAGQLNLQPSFINIIPYIQRIVKQFQQQTQKHQIELLTRENCVFALVDSTRLVQIVTNLLDNAIKYSPQGGPITIEVKTDPVSGGVQLTVQDRGIGIPKHQQINIFGRFMRAENARAWGIHGTGLGLYLCHELAECLGGHLWFESEEGKGSLFYLTLPVVERTHLSLLNESRTED